MRNPGTRWFILMCMASCFILMAFFGKFIIHANSHMLIPAGDGFKNYFTPAYYIAYDQGTHFSGMNYPYGEHVVFTDNQPIISSILKLINQYIFNISDMTVGIINIIMMLSILSTVIFIYLILRKFQLPYWYAAIIAIIIAFLSPQIARLTGHYALAHVDVIPVILYLTIRLFEKRSMILWGSLLTIFIAFLPFVHPYYLAITVSFLMATLLVHLIQHGKAWHKNLGIYGHLLIAAIIPFLIFSIWMGQTDMIDDRIDTPWGFLLYAATIQSIFLPVYGPIFEFLSTSLGYNRSAWEGFAYVGLPGLLVLILFTLKTGKYIWKRSPRKILVPVVPKPLPTFFWASVLILLFSFGFPFILGLESLIDKIGPLKQFRSLGRFAWIFFYVFTVYSAAYLYFLFKAWIRLRRFKAAYSLIIIALMVWSFEAYHNVNETALHIYRYNEKPTNLFQKPDHDYLLILKENGYKPSDFQAILGLPFFLRGSEKFDIYRNNHTLISSMAASYQLGLPLASGTMSRTSISQSLKLSQLISSEHIIPVILDDYKNNKPLLAIVRGELNESNEQRLVNDNTFLIYQEGDIRIYELPIHKIASNFIPAIKSRFSVLRDSLFKGDQYLSLTETHAVIIKDGMNQMKGPLSLFKGFLPTATAKDTFEASVWIEADIHSPGFPIFRYLQANAKGVIVDQAQDDPKFTNEVYENMVRASIVFTLEDSTNYIGFYIVGSNIKTGGFLLHPINQDIYYNINDDGSFTYNNYFIP